MCMHVRIGARGHAGTHARVCVCVCVCVCMWACVCMYVGVLVRAGMHVRVCGGGGGWFIMKNNGGAIMRLATRRTLGIQPPTRMQSIVWTLWFQSPTRLHRRTVERIES